MARLFADIEALKNLRHVLLTFANRQAALMQSPEQEINQTLDELYTSITHAEARVNVCWRRLARCREEAAYAYYYGHYIDCSPCVNDLQMAQEQLDQLRKWVTFVNEAVSRYHAAYMRMERLLHDYIPQATNYLLRCIEGLEAYYAEQNLSAAQAILAVAVEESPGLMGGAIGTVRHSEGMLRKAIGAAGEEAATNFLQEQFGWQEIPFDQPVHGFDRLFRSADSQLIIVESKVSSAGKLKLGQTQDGQQGSPAWIESHSQRMGNPNSAAHTPANAQISQLIQQLGVENIPTYAVVVNPTTTEVDLYQRQDDDSWALVEPEVLDS